MDLQSGLSEDGKALVNTYDHENRLPLNVEEDLLEYRVGGSCLTCPFRKAYVNSIKVKHNRLVKRNIKVHECHHAHRGTHYVSEHVFERGNLTPPLIAFGSNEVPKGEKRMPCKGYIAALKATKGCEVIII